MRAREKLFNMTNLAAAVDMYSKSSLMTLLFVIIIYKQTTGRYGTSCHQLFLIIGSTSNRQIDSSIQ